MSSSQPHDAPREIIPGHYDIRPIDWNAIQDEKDSEVWDRLTANFWLPEKVPLSNDINNWRGLTDLERDTTMRVFAGLTNLDTVQAQVGAEVLSHDSATQHENAIFTNIGFMESVHAKSYSSIFQTLSNSADIQAAMRWTYDDEDMATKRARILEHYWGDDPFMKKVSSVFLESFLFYSGFYLPLHYSAHAQLTNTADIIRLIMRDEAVHGYYIGYKYQTAVAKLSQGDQEILKERVFNLLEELYETETHYAHTLYDELGWTDQVMQYVRYNANRALNNLGYEHRYSAEESRVEPEILAAMDPGGNENHDFFSGSGSSYTIGTAEDTTDDDWEF